MIDMLQDGGCLGDTETQNALDSVTNGEAKHSLPFQSLCSGLLHILSSLSQNLLSSSSHSICAVKSAALLLV